MSIASLTVCAALLAAQAATEEQASTDAARAVIAGLSDELAEEFAEQLRMESSWRKDFRASLQGYLLRSPPRDPATWPLLEPAPLYNAKRHCPAQPIQRRRLNESDPRSARAVERFAPDFAESAPELGWVYDYPSEELRRAKDWNSPKRLLRNALLGFQPDQDLALAVLEQRLDSGEQRAVLTAFAHGYADRRGNVYPGVTLYDAWASGADMEMPDVECLGVVHDLLDDWKTWKAPVRKQDSLYETIEELFIPARQHRGLRHALAMAYLCGAEEPLAEYSANHVQLHALWEDCSSTPSALGERLPNAKQWRSFLEDWRDEVKGDAALQARARGRWEALNQSAAHTRELVLRILRENELLKD